MALLAGTSHRRQQRQRASVIGLGLSVLLLASAAQASRARSAPKRYVVIVANNYSLDSGVAPLKYADDDGVRYYELFGWAGADVSLLTVLDDETARLYPDLARVARPPTAANLFATLDRLNDKMAADARASRISELVFVYAGHGDRDESGEGYVNLTDQRLRRRDLYQKILAPSRASYVHLIVDACKSYFLVNRRGGDERGDSGFSAEFRAFLDREQLRRYPHAGVILATSGDQSTHEWRRYRGGVLSHELRSGLAGAADINGDGRIEYSELHAFISAANARVSHPEARLHIFARPPEARRGLPLMDLRQAIGARLVRFDKTLGGRFHLEDDRGIRVADLNKAPGVGFDVAVDRRRSYFVRSGGLEAKIIAGLGRVRVAELAFSHAETATRSASVDRSFRRDLYRLPFSRGFYDGFCLRAGHLPVVGSDVAFVIERRDPPIDARHRGGVGYLLNPALLDLAGLSHGIDVYYSYRVWRFLAAGARLQYAGSAHEHPTGSASLHRFAALVGGSAQFALGRWLRPRADLYFGYQGLAASGSLKLEGIEVEGGDPFGFRLETGAGLRLSLGRRLHADLRGGVSLDLVTVGDSEHVHVAPYVGTGLGLGFF